MMKITVLGCGASGGVPLITGNWGECSPENPKNIRTRCSLSLHIGNQVWLIDMSPDLRQQCIREKIYHVDGVLCTHTHFDHVGGIDELKPFSINQKKLIPIYSDKESLQSLASRYPYAFENPYFEEAPQIYKWFLKAIEVHDPFYIDNVLIIPFQQNHRYSHSLGFRFPSWGYSTDVWELDDEAFEILKGVDLWIVDCIDIRPRATHAHLERTLSWVERLAPREVMLIHMSHQLDYDKLRSLLPDNVYPAYDGMVIEVEDKANLL